MVFPILRVRGSSYIRLQIFLENDRKVGPHFTHFRERRQGVPGGYESTHRYHISLLIAGAGTIS